MGGGRCKTGWGAQWGDRVTERQKNRDAESGRVTERKKCQKEQQTDEEKSEKKIEKRVTRERAGRIEELLSASSMAGWYPQALFRILRGLCGPRVPHQSQPALAAASGCILICWGWT